MVREDKKRLNENSIKYLKVAKNLVYFSVLLILIFILVVQIAGCIETYILHPTYVETKIVAQRKALFPAMTICPVSKGYKEDVLKV